MFHQQKIPSASKHTRQERDRPPAMNTPAAGMLRKHGCEARIAAPVQAKATERGERLAANDLGYTQADREYRELFLGARGLKKARGEALVACLAIGYAIFRTLETRLTGASADGSIAVEIAIGIGVAILGLAIYHCVATKHRLWL